MNIIDCKRNIRLSMDGFGTIDKAIFLDPRLKLNIKVLYMYLCAHRDSDTNPLPYPYVMTISKEIEMNYETITKYTKKLKDLGILKINDDFTYELKEDTSQGRYSIPNSIILSKNIPPQSKAVYATILVKNDKGAYTQQKLADSLKIHIETYRKYYRKLKKSGFLDCLQPQKYRKANN